MSLLTLRIALKSLKRNKVRTFLTMVGVVIGIAAVITVMSVGDGLKSYVLGQLESFGTDTISVEIKVPSTGRNSSSNAQGIAQGIQITTLTREDADAIEKLPGTASTYSYILGQSIVSYESEKKQILLWGTTESFVDIDASKVGEGRFFTEDEDLNAVQVAVLGSKVKDELFGDDDALDKSISVGGKKFRIIGVMESRGAVAFFDLDNIIYLPLGTLQNRILGVDHVTAIIVQAKDQNRMDELAQEVTFLVRDRHDITDPDKDDFGVTTIAEALGIFNTVFGAINLLLGAIAGISLLVGGVGIMNIMYVSVTERTYEIGLRKSVGATQKKILWQFLWEAIMMTFAGAIIGFILGVSLSFIISVVAGALGFGWAFSVSPFAVILASGVSLAIGLAFGVFPARAAAKLDPVEALRQG
jgi:ABC-type antimicrobial peptide transport system permease subunit